AIAVMVVAPIATFAVTLYGYDPMGLRDIYARLFPANYERQDLSGEDYRGRALAYANFKQAKLREVEFSDANLQFADLRGADFLATGVSGANFSNALFDGAILRIARGQDTGRHAAPQQEKPHDGSGLRRCRYVRSGIAPTPRERCS
ncbi:MAG: pentapeptide repeat-containing protein, partial [Burkholderiales bacterium]